VFYKKIPGQNEGLLLRKNCTLLCVLLIIKVGYAYKNSDGLTLDFEGDKNSKLS
jgi:hypothetical protein